MLFITTTFGITTAVLAYLFFDTRKQLADYKAKYYTVLDYSERMSKRTLELDIQNASLQSKIYTLEKSLLEFKEATKQASTPAPAAKKPAKNKK